MIVRKSYLFNLRHCIGINRMRVWLKTILVLSAEIGDIFCPGKAGNIELSFNLIK